MAWLGSAIHFIPRMHTDTCVPQRATQVSPESRSIVPTGQTAPGNDSFGAEQVPYNASFISLSNSL